MRLTSRKEFARVFSDGRKTVGRSLILWHYAEPEGEPRLGLSVGARVGNAVRRNRLKRLTREAFRFNSKRLRPGLDLVVYLRPGCRWKGLADAARDFMEACGRAGLLAS